MTLKTTVQTALAAIITAAPDSVVTVIANGNTASGVRDTVDESSDLANIGQRGITISKVRCNADTIVASSLKRGQTIKIDDTDVFVNRFYTDPIGAVVCIEYSEQRPLEGISDPVM